MSFRERLRAASERSGSLLCVGLDPDPARLPTHLGPADDARTVLAFNRAIIESTTDLVCAYKPNLGFYLAYGPAGVEALIETRRLIPPEIPVILDAKVGDLGNTSVAYARAYFDAWNFDAVTVHPYMGEDSLEPFLSRSDRAVFVLVKTSNPGSGDLQDLPVTDEGTTEPLYLRVAERARRWQGRYGTCGLVVGATYPRQLAEVRERCPDLPILVPGVGAQGGDLTTTVQAGLDPAGGGLLINAARGVIYAGTGPDFAQAARRAAIELRDAINQARQS
ncbi:orotidine-5'-phosphate decarboxylase [Sphaerobacter thermophilus]|uniref:Orotidine 5'-phosphate decarboxylase n=1 Tax=Sphaerobacter thermophilus (strain ATCC 49802 / DSM 20745 / KCCM 41009 / NCIMB 13125 / S 6022) TaxID=479434 RepID=D1C1H3_SPHTD|nr:orotidine-5'-phosphate decarboxylase [Sphaerobacter thermophilus]ACZ38090.1 orotidine 5'-phosphate decarboxylase [Sphaerobacter thermophilus DSM 20745]